ncbi:amidohydrolase family protein [Frateuria sp. STR12]|uniref:amidohydrolase family protein n=1 Tax=Frateuria hangzhouensis TaxID=2995589 RepID=UPI002260A5EF|nr:amidohydrolase family protein [Frateuria sp. STR12]MCX7514745.1 amidohydrolase family protein [Frateuria sp. STR12]
MSGLVIASAAIGLAPAAEPAAAIRVDHHTHLNSPAIQAFVPKFCQSIRRYGKCDAALTTPHSPADLLVAMDKAGIERALVLSTGYLPQSPMMDPPPTNAAQLMRAANDWTVGLARDHPDRFRAFVAVDPLRPTALAEIARWKGNPAVAGLKLHLTSSGVELRNDAHVAALARVFRAAAKAHWAIVVHLRTQRGDYGAADVQRFVRDVLPAAAGTPVQIAHAGGWGGIDKATLSALGAFAHDMQADPQAFRHVWFDLSGVWTGKTPSADKRAFVALIRKIGPRHFLPGSDWPYNGTDLADYYGRIYPQLPLTPTEWAVIRSNVAPYAR